MKKIKIEFKNVRKQYGELTALNNINLSIYEGEIFGIVGRSGAGKSTLLRTINRLEEIVALLEEEQTDLDASVKLFEEGIALSKEMSTKLQEVKFKVTALKKKGAVLLAEPFEATETAETTESTDGE